MRSKVLVVGILLLALLAGAGASAQAQTSLDVSRHLAGLCQVWGLLKYHHPGVAARDDWDEALLSAIPRVEAAGGKAAFNKAIVDLVADAGLAYVFGGRASDIPRDGAALGAIFRWIDDGALFEPETQLVLKAVVVAHRPGPNRWVLPTVVGNPDFKNESADTTSYPDEPHRLLALFRFWNAVQYYFPNRDIMDREWGTVLLELVPKFINAASAVDYSLAVLEMTASINDAHAFTYSGAINLYWGVNTIPARARLIEGRTTVTMILPSLLDRGADLRVGDVITHIDGVPVEATRKAMRPLVNASNDASLELNIHGNLLRTNETQRSLTVVREGGVVLTVTVNAVPRSRFNAEAAAVTGDTWTILPGNVGYVHMGRLMPSDVTFVMGQLRNTRAIVFDIRNYPNSTLYSVANYLGTSAWPFAKFSFPDMDHPGSLGWTAPWLAGPNSPNAWSGTVGATYTYTGRVVLLVDQETVSHAEYTAMALRTSPNAVVVGSQTAGADGNVSGIALPGGVVTAFSGLGVFYADGTPTQRVGIVPDFEVRPTVRGIREGRDEVLEAALGLLR